MGKVIALKKDIGIEAVIEHAMRAAECGDLQEIAIAGRYSNGDSMACVSKNSTSLLGAVHLLASAMAASIAKNEFNMD